MVLEKSNDGTGSSRGREDAFNFRMDQLRRREEEAKRRQVILKIKEVKKNNFVLKLFNLFQREIKDRLDRMEAERAERAIGRNSIGN
jgi:hypothetical protein